MNIINWALSILIHCLNFIIEAFGALLSILFFWLPNSPFQNEALMYNATILKYVGYLNYIFPIKEVVVILTAWGVCVGGYMLYSIVLRWVKAIE